MRFVCPKDVKKMVVQRARSVYWKKWAAKHEYEEFERASSLAKESEENWTEKHRKKEEGTDKHRQNDCPEWYEVRREIPEVSKKLEQKARTSKKEWKSQRGIVEHPLSGNQWNKGHFSMRKWDSEKYKSWGMPAEGSKGHVATDGSSLGNDGKRRACVGQWYRWTAMKRWNHRMTCMAQLSQNLRFSAPSRGRS